MSTSLTILTTAIRQDAEGRYCLNDCHKASGSLASKGPNEWMKNAQTKALIAALRGDREIPPSPSETDVEIPTSPVSSIKGGTNQGTYVAKELVYAYAMWISPAFHLRVIRAFDAMMQVSSTAEATPTLPTVGRVINGGNATEYYLNKKQAVFITAKSETPEAQPLLGMHHLRTLYPLIARH